MKDRKKLKGFTLIELIVVMAIFGILMVAVMSVINPLNKLSKRTSITEANAAAVDNIKNYLEGTLRYSDCIEVCQGGLTDNTGALFSSYTADQLSQKYGVKDFGANGGNVSVEEAAVINFLDNHYSNRPGGNGSSETEMSAPVTGKVRMVKIDNNNGGVISGTEWDFTAGYTYAISDAANHLEGAVGRVNATIKNAKTTPSLINSLYYDEYSFYIKPGFNTMVTDFDRAGNIPEEYYASIQPYTLESGATYTGFSTDMFSMSVVVYPNGTNSLDAPYREDEVFCAPFQLSNINMSLVNIKSDFTQGSTTTGRVVDWGPQRIAKDNKLDFKKEGDAGSEKIVYGQIKQDPNPNTSGSTACAPKINDRLFVHTPVASSDGCIYFIYTLPDFK